MKPGVVLLGSMTVPGKPEHLRAARAFVAATLGEDCGCADTAVLLASELITNSMQYSDSRRDGGTVTIILIAVPAGIRVEVIDGGGTGSPVMRPVAPGSELAERGRGLQMVEMLSARWGYYQDAAGTVTWFELAAAADA
jgi:anti-sigma regulatory factor (Ser/Thr protein kinase)